MRITSQDEMIDVNYDMCTLRVLSAAGKNEIIADTAVGAYYTLGEFPTKIAAIQELTRIFSSWKMGCANHQVRKTEG